MLSDDPTFEELTAHFVRYQESRNLSPNTLRVYDQFFRQFRRFAEEQGLTVTAATMTSDLFENRNLRARLTRAHPVWPS